MKSVKRREIWIRESGGFAEIICLPPKIFWPVPLWVSSPCYLLPSKLVSLRTNGVVELAFSILSALDIRWSNWLSTILPERQAQIFNGTPTKNLTLCISLADLNFAQAQPLTRWARTSGKIFADLDQRCIIDLTLAVFRSLTFYLLTRKHNFYVSAIKISKKQNFFCETL